MFWNLCIIQNAKQNYLKVQHFKINNKNIIINSTCMCLNYYSFFYESLTCKYNDIIINYNLVLKLYKNKNTFHEWIIYNVNYKCTYKKKLIKYMFKTKVESVENKNRATKIW